MGRGVGDQENVQGNAPVDIIITVCIVNALIMKNCYIVIVYSLLYS